MAERVHTGGGIGAELGERGQDDTRRPEHHRERARFHRAHAERRRLLVSRTRDLRRLVHGREPFARNRERVCDFLGPAPAGDVEEQRARRVGDVGRVLPGEAQPDVVLGQQDVADPGVDVRLVPSQPQQLRSGEARKRTVARQRDQTLEPEQLLDLGALGACALVVPEDRRTKHAIRFVEADEAVHLAREPHAGRLDAERRQRLLARLPPVLGILLRPARLRRRERVALLGRGDHVARRRDRKRFHAGRPDVDPDEVFHYSPPRAA